MKDNLLLELVRVENQQGTLIWIIKYCVIGLTLEILVDDATGKVLEINTLGKR